MATLPSITPTYGAQKASAPIVYEVGFGDGYSQRTVWGQNQDPKVWSLTWLNISETDADTLEAFFEARQGQESFNWTPPDESAVVTTRKWICSSWTKTIPYNNRATINATFLQVFEP
jgi:phage-related protein